ncbi:hypothetical protein JCM14635_25670 [Megalodesulfovibrio paquesii]
MPSPRRGREHSFREGDRGAGSAGQRLVWNRGAPRHLRSDNGPEFVSTALLRWAAKESLGSALIDPGKPWQNGTAESFNGKFRDECLSMKWFRSRAEAKAIIEGWRRHYNTVRPHSSLGNMTPGATGKRQRRAKTGAPLSSNLWRKFFIQ